MSNTAWLSDVAALVQEFLPQLLADMGGLAWLGDGVDAWFALQCHREAGRSPQLLGSALSVCWRCFGIYVGLGLGALLLRPRLRPRALRIWLITAATLMVADVATEGLGLRPQWAPIRLLSGWLLAYPVGSAIVWAVRGQAQVQKP